jgi:hypothetical protein
MLTWPVFDATTSLAVLAVVFDPTDPCTCLQDGARHDDGQKIPPSEQADKTPQQGKNYQAKDSDKHSLTCISHLFRHSLVAVLP